MCPPDVPARPQWIRDVSVNDSITFKVSGSGTSETGRCRLCVRVLKVQRFRTFSELLAKCGVGRVLPGVADVEQGVAIYYALANRGGVPYRKLEHDHGVVALTVQPLQ